MDTFLFQTILPFLLSACIVIIITVLAEKFGTKTGGIFGTLPSTIIIAYAFIAHNKGLFFASEAVAVVPAELGINLLFLFTFILTAKRYQYYAVLFALIVWILGSVTLFVLNLSNIFLSLSIFLICLLITISILEKKIQIKSQQKVQVHYDLKKMILRGVLAGMIISLSVLLSNVNAVISGIFSVFPAIFISTIVIQLREHGPAFAIGMAKSMMIGISSVCTYAVLIHFLYPLYGIVIGSSIGFCIAFMVTLLIFFLRKKIQ